jgi:hypothetical protein
MKLIIISSCLIGRLSPMSPPLRKQEKSNRFLGQPRHLVDCFLNRDFHEFSLYEQQRRDGRWMVDGGGRDWRAAIVLRVNEPKRRGALRSQKPTSK